MNLSLPTKVSEVLLRDAVWRDLTTARRVALVKILLHERYLTRPQLMSRVEDRLGRGCFGDSAWEDVFYRDMRVVKAALKAAGHLLEYSRSTALPGYFLHGEPIVSAELFAIFKKSAAEVDEAQIEILHRLTPADRFQIGCSMTDTARDAVAYRVQQQHPELDLCQASYFALQGKLPGEQNSHQL